MSQDFYDRENSAMAFLALLFVRGVLLWLVIPLATIGWACAYPYFHHRRVILGQFLGWIDLNLVAFLERSILRTLFSSPLPWVRASAMVQVTHRISLLDPA